MDKTFNFTKKDILSLELPTGNTRLTYYDKKQPGLSLRVTSKGTKTFIVYRKVNSRPERITLGHFPDLTIERARDKAQKALAYIVDGINPNEQKRAFKAEQTLGEFFNDYLERHAKVHKKSWTSDRAQFNRYLDKWRSRKLSAIRKSDIQTLHSKIGKEHGTYSANRLLALLRVIFNKAIEWGYEKPNPALRIKQFKERSRERFLEADELPRFFESLAQETNTTARDYFLMSLLTGARRSNVQAMRWEQINLNRKTWTIPDTKSGDPHTVPLVQTAIEILEDRSRDSDSDFVFPGTGKTGHLVEPKKAWYRILDRADLKNLRIHDLRRSLGSWQAATGANLSIIGKTLAHKNINTTAIYARLGLDPVRESMNKATDAILEAGYVKTKSNVRNIID